MDAKILCLGVLVMGDASGYEIRQSCEEGALNNFHHIGYGSIYPALNSLLKEGKVSCTAMPQEKKPDKKVYSITKKGMEFFTKSLIKEPTEDKHKSEILFMLFFANYLTTQHIDVILDTFLSNIASKLKKIENCQSSKLNAGQKFVRGLGEKVNIVINEYIKENRSSLINEIEKERSQKGQLL